MDSERKRKLNDDGGKSDGAKKMVSEEPGTSQEMETYSSEDKMWWIVQYHEGGKCGAVNESQDIVALGKNSSHLDVGGIVDVVLAQNKANGRRYRATVLKGPFDQKKEANNSLSLCAKPIAVDVPRSCASCKVLSADLRSQMELCDSLSKY